MSDRERIVGYVDGEVKQDVESLIDNTDQSMSAFVAEAVREKIQREQLERLSDQYDIEQRLLRMVQDATDRVVDETAEAVTAELLEQLDRQGLIDDKAADDDGGGDDDSDWNL